MYASDVEFFFFFLPFFPVTFLPRSSIFFFVVHATNSNPIQELMFSANCEAFPRLDNRR